MSRFPGLRSKAVRRLRTRSAMPPSVGPGRGTVLAPGAESAAISFALSAGAAPDPGARPAVKNLVPGAGMTRGSGAGPAAKSLVPGAGMTRGSGAGPAAACFGPASGTAIDPPACSMMSRPFAEGSGAAAGFRRTGSKAPRLRTPGSATALGRSTGWPAPRNPRAGSVLGPARRTGTRLGSGAGPDPGPGADPGQDPRPGADPGSAAGPGSVPAPGRSRLGSDPSGSDPSGSDLSGSDLSGSGCPAAAGGGVRAAPFPGPDAGSKAFQEPGGGSGSGASPGWPGPGRPDPGPPVPGRRRAARSLSPSTDGRDGRSRLSSVIQTPTNRASGQTRPDVYSAAQDGC